MTISTKLYTLVKGKYIGQDEFGNRYYCHKSDSKKRWVIYKGINEASKIPPEWHGWMHKITDDIPSPTSQKYKPYKWQKKHQPNLTGTDNAYYPPGHTKAGSKRDKATGDYVAWNPEIKG